MVSDVDATERVDSNDPRSIAGKSGFLLQLAVEDSVRAGRKAGVHTFDVVRREHPWSDVRTGHDKYVDLLLQRDDVRVIVECKRAHDSTWVFLAPNEPDLFPPTTAQLARAVYDASTQDGGVGSEELALHPHLPDAEFCAVRATKDGDSPMLERIAAELVRAGQAVAQQELRIARRESHDCDWYYVPLIVTCARLTIARFSANMVDLKNGGLPSNFDTEDVPAVCFRRTLASAVTNGAKSLADVQVASERTVIVVNADYLITLLQGLAVAGRKRSRGRRP